MAADLTKLTVEEHTANMHTVHESWKTNKVHTGLVLILESKFKMFFYTDLKVNSVKIWLERKGGGVSSK